MSENIDYEKILIEGNKLKEQITPSRFDLIKGVAFGYCLGRVKVLAIKAVKQKKKLEKSFLTSRS